jgi:hypothetical protein
MAPTATSIHSHHQHSAKESTSEPSWVGWTIHGLKYSDHRRICTVTFTADGYSPPEPNPYTTYPAELTPQGGLPVHAMTSYYHPIASVPTSYSYSKSLPLGAESKQQQQQQQQQPTLHQHPPPPQPPFNRRAITAAADANSPFSEWQAYVSSSMNPAVSASMNHAAPSFNPSQRTPSHAYLSTYGYY